VPELPEVERSSGELAPRLEGQLPDRARPPGQKPGRVESRVEAAPAPHPIRHNTHRGSDPPREARGVPLSMRPPPDSANPAMTGRWWSCTTARSPETRRSTVRGAHGKPSTDPAAAGYRTDVRLASQRVAARQKGWDAYTARIGPAALEEETFTPPFVFAGRSRGGQGRGSRRTIMDSGRVARGRHIRRNRMAIWGEEAWCHWERK